MDKKDKKVKNATPTTLNSEEVKGDSSVIEDSEEEDSDEETESYGSEDESVDTESDSESTQDEGTVAPDEGSVTPDDQTNSMPQIAGDILAQIEAQSSGHDCTFAHRRNKADLDQYWTIRGQ